MRLISYMNCETAVQMSCLTVNGKLYLQSLQDGRHTAATVRQGFYLNNLVKHLTYESDYEVLTGKQQIPE